MMSGSLAPPGQVGDRKGAAMMRLKKRLLLAGALLVVGGAAVGITYAAIPSGGVISGCYQKNGGQLRVIDSSSSSCKSNETDIAWNQQGVKGDTGATGAVGATGPTGETGQQGIPGVSGRVVITSQPQGGGHAATAECPAGKSVLGGGYNGGIPTFNGPLEVLGIPAQGWVAIGPDGIVAYAICATVN